MGQQEVRVGVTSEDAMKAFATLKQACMTAPILAFADYTNAFMLETDASKEGFGWFIAEAGRLAIPPCCL